MYEGKINPVEVLKAELAEAIEAFAEMTSIRVEQINIRWEIVDVTQLGGKAKKEVMANIGGIEVFFGRA